MSGSQGKNLRSALQNEKNILTQRQGCQNFYMRLTLSYPSPASPPHDKKPPHSDHYGKGHAGTYQIRDNIDFTRNHPDLPINK